MALYKIIPKDRDIAVMHVYADEVQYSEIANYSTLIRDGNVVGCVWQEHCDLILDEEATPADGAGESLDASPEAIAAQPEKKAEVR